MSRRSSHQKLGFSEFFNEHQYFVFSNRNWISFKMATIGEISQKEESVIEWVIKDFKSLSAEDGAYYSSPLFDFANLSWFLKIYPNGISRTKPEGHISAFLQRKFPGPSITIEYILGVKTEEQLGATSARVQYIYKEKQSYSFHTFVSSSEVLERKYRIQSFVDTLILVCQLKSSKCVEFESKENSSVRRNKILCDYKDLFLKRKDCDVIIKIKEQEFPAHRIILSARSPVFESTFRNDMKEKRTGIIDIEDCDPSTFLSFLDFLYCGDTEIITVENVFSLFTVADKYDVCDLRGRCLEFLKKNLSIDTFCDTIALAQQYSENELIEITTDFFSKNGLEITKSDKWKTFIACNPAESNELLIKAFELLKDVKK